MTIGAWITAASARLANEMIESARLDAEIIIAHTLNQPRTWLHAHSTDQLDERRRDIADARVQLRIDRVPIAYIVGHKEFYGRRFVVSPEVLIPRPESEALISHFIKYAPSTPSTTGDYQVVDVGTGSGCLGITAKLERVTVAVTLSDISRHALTIARKNAERLGADVHVIESDLLGSYPYAPDCIIANLPYVDESWNQSPELGHEPAEALFASEGGLSYINQLIDQAAQRQKPGSLLLIEADTRQLAQITQTAADRGYQLLDSSPFSLALRR